MDRPRAGVHYPRSLGEFEAWFSTDRDCLDYLQWLRWPEGFACPDCGHVGGWQLGDGRFWCTGCAGRTSVTAGTIFDRARTPLTVWFAASWLFATQKDGISALSLRRELEVGSYQTAWAMLHRLRSVLVRPGRDRLAGAVEVDETYIGGEEAGLAGGRAKGKKSLVGIAVEVREPKGLGRCRMGVLADASAGSLHPFVSAHVEPGFQGDHRRLAGICRHRQAWLRPRTAQPAGYPGAWRGPFQLLPGPHRVASLAKRWLLGTHQGSVNEAHLQSYLDEFVFRFSRRHSRSRGMVFYRLLELAVAHGPVRYRDLVENPQPKRHPASAQGHWGQPPSLERASAHRPWRTTSDQLHSG